MKEKKYILIQLFHQLSAIGKVRYHLDPVLNSDMQNGLKHQHQQLKLLLSVTVLPQRTETISLKSFSTLLF